MQSVEQTILLKPTLFQCINIQYSFQYIKSYWNIWKHHFYTLIAVGALESVTRVPAASYFTAGLDDCSKL